MDSVDIKSLVHQLFPKVKTVCCSLDDLLFKFSKLLFEVVDLNDVQSGFVSEKRLVLPVHDMLYALLCLIEEVLELDRRLISQELQHLEVTLELVTKLMLENLDLEELEAHTFRELGFYSLGKNAVEELKEQTSELVLIALMLLGIQIFLCLIHLLKVVLWILTVDKALPFFCHLMHLFEVSLKFVF